MTSPVSCRSVQSGRNKPISNNPNNPTIVEWNCPGTSREDTLLLVRELVTRNVGRGTITTAVLTIRYIGTIIATAYYDVDYTGEVQYSNPFMDTRLGFIGTLEASLGNPEQIINLFTTDNRLKYTIYLRDGYNQFLYADIEAYQQGASLEVPGLVTCEYPNPPSAQPIVISDNLSNPTIITWSCTGLSADNSLSLTRQLVTYPWENGTRTDAILTIRQGTNIIATGRYFISSTSTIPGSRPDPEIEGSVTFPFPQLSVNAEPGTEFTETIILSSSDFNTIYTIYTRRQFAQLSSATIKLDEQGDTNRSFGSSVTVANGVVSLNSNAIQLQNNLVEIPAITMRLQTDLRGNNLDEAAFNVFDRISYCSNYPATCPTSGRCINTVADKRTQTCPIIKVRKEDVKKTEYSRNPIGFNKVVRGRGCTLKEKATNINDTTLTTKQFMLRISVFGMLKYILGKMMFGRFDLKWLLRENERELFDKLKENRLCRFIEAFNDPTIKGYGKYFR